MQSWGESARAVLLHPGTLTSDEHEATQHGQSYKQPLSAWRHLRTDRFMRTHTTGKSNVTQATYNTIFRCVIPVAFSNTITRGFLMSQNKISLLDVIILS